MIDSATFAPCLFEHLVKGLGFDLSTNESLAQKVNEFGGRVSQAKGFGVGNRKVKPVSVSCFVPGKPANVAQLLQPGRQIEAFDLLLKVSSFASDRDNKPFKGNAQQSASASRRDADDVLRFYEHASDIVRHELRGFYAACGRINQFFVHPKVNSPASRAARHEVVVRPVKVRRCIDEVGTKSIVGLLNRARHKDSFHRRGNAAMGA